MKIVKGLPFLALHHLQTHKPTANTEPSLCVCHLSWISVATTAHQSFSLHQVKIITEDQTGHNVEINRLWGAQPQMETSPL